MTGLDWLNPIRWMQAFSHFVWCWVVSLPIIYLAAAAPAILGLAFIVLVTSLTYTSDPQWRRGLLLDQLRDAKQAGSTGDVALLTRRLLKDTPDNLPLQYEAALAAGDGDAAGQRSMSMRRLAKEEQYGRAAFWLLENEFSPIEWDKWDDKKKSEFGTLVRIAAEDQPDNKAVASIYADYLLLTGAQEKALGEITKLVSVQPARALQGAIILRHSGRESQAATMARDGLERLAKQSAEEPENVNLALLCAQFSLFLKQYENAVSILDRAAKRSDDPRLRAGAAESFVLWSRDQASIADSTARFARQLTLLSKAVEIAPNHPLVISDLMAVALQCADEKDTKVAELRDLLVQGVAPELAHFIRGTAAMMRDDVAEATLHLELAAKGLPAAPAVLNNLAVALASRDTPDLERALRLVDAALKQVPSQPYFHETRAQILLKMERYADAVVSFEQALPATALRVQVHGGLSDAYRALGQDDLADQHQRLAEQSKKSNAQSPSTEELKVDFAPKTPEQTPEQATVPKP
ncbi:MAG: hypothetical protein ACO1RT_16075 [Planctomycetaceae bacterium]